MKRKGFTLIELLAVIVILAIIALIATPIILGIINDARKESNARSAELYLSGVELAIARKNLTEEFNPETCTITESVVTCDGKELSVEVDGKVPTSGTIVFKDNKVISGTVLTFDGFTATIEDGKVVVGNGDVTEPTIEPICTAVSSSQYGNVPANDSSGNRVFVPGDEYTCEVKEGTSYTFYVLSTNTDSNGSVESVNLIMDSNVGKVNWITKTDYLAAGGIIPEETYKDESQCQYGDLCAGTDLGPVTAEKALYNATSDWDNIAITYSLYNSDYVKVNDGKARLPEEAELNNVALYVAPSWLLTTDNNSFWNSVGLGGPGAAGAYFLTTSGLAMGGADAEVKGVRPVISVAKEYLK